MLWLALWLPQVADARTNILLVFDEDKDFPGLSLMNRSLREVFWAGLHGDVEFYSESLNLSQFKDPAHDDVLHDYFRRKYAGKRVDLVVAVMGPSLDFLLRHGSTILPGVPVVFCGADASDVDRKTLGPNVTGVAVKRAFAATLDLALQLHPDTRKVVVVSGGSTFDRHLQTIARRQFAPFEGRTEITYLNALPMDNLLKTLSRLPPRSVIFYLTVLADGGGRAFVPHEALSLIAGAANAPIYVSVDQYVGHGAVGGNVYSVATHGRHTAEMGLRILRGEKPSSIPVTADSAQANMFDWRQLQRWRIDEKRLPAGSVVNFRTLSMWDLYKWYIAAGAALLVLQSALIVGLLVTHVQRRRAQRTLAERLQFETLLSELSAAFLTLPTSAIDETIDGMLERVARTLDVDRAVLAERPEEANTMRVAHVWTRPGVAPLQAPFKEEALPWVAARVIRGDVIRIARLAELPDDAAIDRDTFLDRGLRSLAVVPLRVAGTVVGALGLGRVRGERAWPDELMASLQMLADVFANVLARQHAESAVQASDDRRRRAEEESQRQRDELAHALRVATLGEMAASFAHEISQPLAAIRINAQGVRRLLAANHANPGDVEETLGDIADDSTRAMQTIQRLRSLFRKEPAERVAVDVNELIEDVLGLLRSDFQSRRMAVQFARQGRLSVTGDPVQLRQVLLNLLVNAADAVAAAPDGPREIHVDISRPDPQHVRIGVRDSGIGVADGPIDRIFEHFVTTKPQGLGMGLAISRSIVEAHGGRIWATRNDDRGVTLSIELPVETPAARWERRL